MIKIDKTIPLLIPLFVILLTQDLLWPFSGTPYSPNIIGTFFNQYSGQLEKIFPLIALLYAIYYIPRTKKIYLFFSIFTALYFVFLVFESLYYYQSYFEFPHVFLKILNISIVISFFLFYRKYNNINVHLFIDILFYIILLKLISTPGAFSKSAFISHIRIITSKSVFLFLLPCFYYFNSYILEQNKFSLAKFFLLLFLVIYFQHRSVWVACFSGLFLNLLILVRIDKLNARKAIPYLATSAIIFGIVFVLVAAGSPDIVNKIDQEVTNILNPDEDKTGSWRLLQFESYLPFIKDHLFEGMRLKGFELPVQFYNMAIGTQMFESNTGHHFHSFYIETLFYFGLLGLSVFILLITLPIFIVFNRKYEKTTELISVSAFVFCGLIYGFAYRLPIYFWSILGLCWALVYSMENKLESK